jgi:hypothetical protein
LEIAWSALQKSNSNEKWALGGSGTAATSLGIKKS